MRLNDFSRLIGIGEITKDVGIQISDPPIVFCAAEENAELKLRSAPPAPAFRVVGVAYLCIQKAKRERQHVAIRGWLRLAGLGCGVPEGRTQQKCF